MLEHTKCQVHNWKFLQHALSRYVYNRSFFYIFDKKLGNLYVYSTWQERCDYCSITHNSFLSVIFAILYFFMTIDKEHISYVRTRKQLNWWFAMHYVHCIVPYPHCILITSSHKIKLWEKSAPALATTTTTHKLGNNTGTKRFKHDSPLILSITQIPLNNHNSKRNFKTKRGGLAKHNARRQYKANIMI